MYKLKQKDNTFKLEFNSDDALYEVNRKLKEENNDTLDFTYFSNDYSVDFSKQVISINGTSQDLKLPKNKDNARWINFCRNTVDVVHGELVNRSKVYYMGFQVTIDNVNYKRMIKIYGSEFALVDNSD